MSTSNASQGLQKWLDWLDGQNSWRFILILYFLRWLLILPIAYLSGWLFPDQSDSVFQDLAGLNFPALFLSMLILNPLFETILECTIPYWIIQKLHFSSRRPWLFIFISAGLMAIMHPSLASLLPSLITGFFLAYTYAHFASQNRIKATALTMLFHSCINLVGFTAILLDVI